MTLLNTFSLGKHYRQGCHGQGKVREFFKRSGKILVAVEVSEKSGNFIFRFTKSSEKHKEVKNKEKDIDGLQKKLKQM